MTVSLVERDRQARLAVDDTGPGIAPDDLPHIFERFYRAESARDQRTSGTGLGLAISRVIAEAHGGQIEVTSQLGKGSTFTLILPVRTAAETPRLADTGFLLDSNRALIAP